MSTLRADAKIKLDKLNLNLVGETLLPTTCDIALKEWAVFVKALEQGGQILLLRKGGIREEGRSFTPAHSSFLLFPTYEHQREDLLKEPYRKNLIPPSGMGAKPENVTFTHWAQQAEVINLSEEEALTRISPYHIWTNDYAQKRLRWKPSQPLSLMLLRVYRLGNPQTVANLPAYGGCKSWVSLESEIPLGRLTPVMSEEEFQTTVAEIKDALLPSLV